MTNKVFRGSSDFNYAPPLKTRKSWRWKVGLSLVWISVFLTLFGIFQIVRKADAIRGEREAARRLEWVTAERLWYDAGCRIKSYVSGKRGHSAEYREVWHCPDGTVKLGRATDDK